MKRLSVRLAEWLRLPGAPTTMEQASSAERLETHGGTVDCRPAFRQVVIDLQTEILELIDAHATAGTARAILEIGSGVIPLRDLSSDAISSDIEVGRGIDCLLSATDMPVRDSALRAVVGQNVFHHIPDQSRALHEMSRVLEVGGVIVLLEPYHGWLARKVYPALFSFEGYDVNLPLGETLFDSAGLELPNQASSYIVFDREVATFAREFPNLEIAQTNPLPGGVRYLATGGLNFRQLAPTFGLRLLRRVERSKLGGRVLSKLALHWIVVLRVIK